MIIYTKGLCLLPTFISFSIESAIQICKGKKTDASSASTYSAPAEEEILQLATQITNSILNEEDTNQSKFSCCRFSGSNKWIQHPPTARNRDRLQCLLTPECQ